MSFSYHFYKPVLQGDTQAFNIWLTITTCEVYLHLTLTTDDAWDGGTWSHDGVLVGDPAAICLKVNKQMFSVYKNYSSLCALCNV